MTFHEVNPIHYFALSFPCVKLAKEEKIASWNRHTLPSTAELTGEDSFAKVAMGWSLEGVALQIAVDASSFESFYPDIETGDSVELFFDTRDLKTAGFNTRFCHHFFFLPQKEGSHTKGEITHFRTEDSHPLADPSLLDCTVTRKKQGYHMAIFIKSEALFGFDPRQFSRLGFTYRINRYGESSQHFSVTSQTYRIDQYPSLWASLSLVEK